MNSMAEVLMHLAYMQSQRWHVAPGRCQVGSVWKPTVTKDT